jgi:hypothetical protein
MARKQKNRHLDEFTVSEPISTTLREGTVIHGVIWMHVSRRRGFEVEYQGRRKSDYRRDYTDKGHMRAIARLILAEMVSDEKAGNVSV